MSSPPVIIGVTADPTAPVHGDKITIKVAYEVGQVDATIVVNCSISGMATGPGAAFPPVTLIGTAPDQVTVAIRSDPPLEWAKVGDDGGAVTFEAIYQ